MIIISILFIVVLFLVLKSNKYEKQILFLLMFQNKLIKNINEFVKKRDGYKCMNPDCWKEDNILYVHHIDYDKESFDPKNLITICRSCSNRADINSRQYKLKYKTILHEKYGYDYL